MEKSRLILTTWINYVCKWKNTGHHLVQSRYDVSLNISETDMYTLLNNTKAIRDFLQNEIPELFQAPSERLLKLDGNTPD